MTITPKETIRDVVERRAELFNIGRMRIIDAIRQMPPVECVPLKRGRTWCNIATRPLNDITVTMRDLDAVSNSTDGFDYVVTVLATMLRIERPEVMNLQFIAAMRYYLAILEDIAYVNDLWAKLEVKDKNAVHLERPNRGMTSTVRRYVQLLNGAVTMEQAWNSDWGAVYEAFESAKYDYLEQQEETKRAKKNNKTR